MLSLTFGEQVKIVLSRKGMTIKELAELIEERTGKRMSRQNLTQRLGRDNFQEQDMRLIAEILGCSFQLSILATQEAQERASVIEEVPPTFHELDKLEAAKARKAERIRRRKQEEEAERDITVGELVDMMEAPLEAVQETGAQMQAPEQEAQSAGTPLPEDAGEETVPAEASVEIEEIVQESITAEAEAAPDSVSEEQEAAESLSGIEIVKIEPAKQQPPQRSTYSGRRSDDKEWRDFQPIRQRADVEEDRERGDVNPYTGHEYQSNSVRMHPKRIGYVQVYDRKEHKWTDMTEWAFLGYEERKKAAQGKDYEPPIYLD